MARLARAVAPEIPHHVTQRGNGGQAVFHTDRDRSVYLDTLFDYAARYSLRIWGYCLMSNHVHIVAVPENERSLAHVFGRTHADYARYANVVRRSCGHLWQARFYSCPMDERHVWQALAYVERNSVRAGLVDPAEAYPWSSAAAHCAEHDPDGRLDLTDWQRIYTGERWRDALRLGVDAEEWEERIREATRRGSPLGSDAFVERVSTAVGRDLRPRPPGRPSRQTQMTEMAVGKMV